MPLPNKAPGERYHYADLMTTSEDERIELIKGIPFTRTTPTIHQIVLGEMGVQIANYLRKHPEEGEVFYGPLGVRPFEKEGDRQEDVDTVLEPDLTVICDESKLDHAGCKGAPDMIAEILAPCTMWNDCFVKYRVYEAAGVREYWIVDPDRHTVFVYKLENGRYGAEKLYLENDSVPVGVLKDCRVDLYPVFTEWDRIKGK